MFSGKEEYSTVDGRSLEIYLLEELEEDFREVIDDYIAFITN